MPLYDYQCSTCRHAFEMRQSIDADPRATCPSCRSVSRRKFTAVPVIYKSAGFYTTDFGRGRQGGTRGGPDQGYRDD
jgi:putative FmdB family regulatory protein